MGYSLTPFAVDLGKVAAVIGSKDKSLLAKLTKKFKDELEEIDDLGEDLEDQEADEGEENDEDGNEGMQESLEKLTQVLEGAKEELQKGETPEQVMGKLEKKKDIPPELMSLLHSFMSEDKGDDDEDSEEEDEEAPSGPPRASAAEALRHLVLGEEKDCRVGFKYGYVLRHLCQHFGEELEHEQWSSMRRGSEWFKELDKALRSAGVPAKTLSVRKHLAERGAPVAIPKYSDFPSIGYLKAEEIERALEALGKARLDEVEGEAQEFIVDVWTWLKTCKESGRDLVCFYA